MVPLKYVNMLLYMAKNPLQMWGKCLEVGRLCCIIWWTCEITEFSKRDTGDLESGSNVTREQMAGCSLEPGDKVASQSWEGQGSLIFLGSPEKNIALPILTSAQGKLILDFWPLSLSVHTFLAFLTTKMCHHFLTGNEYTVVNLPF